MHFINIEEVLRACGCVHEGNRFYALTSGRVANSYVHIKPLFSYPNYLQAVANMLMRDSPEFSAITGPATASSVLISTCAGAITHRFRNNELRALYRNQKDEYIPDRQAYEAAFAGTNVIVVEDISSTGTSAKTIAEKIKVMGGTVVGFRFIWNRAPSLINEETMGAPVYSLYDEEVPNFLPQDHPEWGTWPLVTDLGNAHLFPDYPGPRIRVL